MTVLRDNIAAFDGMRPELEWKHRNQWVLFRRGEFIGAYPDFASAGERAEQRFGEGPYLIRRVNEQARNTLLHFEDSARSLRRA